MEKLFQNRDFKNNELEAYILKQREELQKQMIDMNFDTRAELLKLNTARITGKAYESGIIDEKVKYIEENFKDQIEFHI